MIIIKKILKDLGKEKTFVFVMLMQVVLIASITLILSFTAVFFSPESLMADKLSIGLINFDDNLKKELFNEDIKLTLFDYNKENIKEYIDSYGEEYNNLEIAILDIQQGNIDTLIVLEEINPYIFAIYLPESEIQSSLILSYVKEKFEIFENKIHKNYVDVIEVDKVRVIGRRDKGSDYIYEIIYGFLLPFLFLVPIFLVGSLIIDIVTQEIESKTLLLIRTATNLKRYFNEVLIASFLMSFLQIILWTILIQLRGIKINNIPELMIYLSLFSFFISTTAIFIAMKFRTKARSQLIYSVLIMLISVSIGISQLNPVAFISIIVSDIIIAPLIGYILIALISVIIYILLLQTEKKEI